MQEKVYTSEIYKKEFITAFQKDLVDRLREVAYQSYKESKYKDAVIINKENNND